MAAPAPTPAPPSATYQYPPKVVELRGYADSISKKVNDLKSKPDSTPAQISAHALSIAGAVESACVGRSLEVLEPFAAVAVEEIVGLFTSCCTALDAASRKPRFDTKLSTSAARHASSRSPSPPALPTESPASLDDYRVSLEAVISLFRIENGQSQLVYSGTVAPLSAQDPAFLYAAISKSTVINPVIKTSLQVLANLTDGLPFPYKAVAQTVLQLYQHVEEYRAIDSSIVNLIPQVEDFVVFLAKPGGQFITPGDDIARAIEIFFRAVQCMTVRLEILKATARIKKLAVPADVKTAAEEIQAELNDALTLLYLSSLSPASYRPDSTQTSSASPPPMHIYATPGNCLFLLLLCIGGFGTICTQYTWCTHQAGVSTSMISFVGAGMYADVHVVAKRELRFSRAALDYSIVTGQSQASVRGAHGTVRSAVIFADNKKPSSLYSLFSLRDADVTSGNDLASLAGITGLTSLLRGWANSNIRRTTACALASCADVSLLAGEREHPRDHVRMMLAEVNGWPSLEQ